MHRLGGGTVSASLVLRYQAAVKYRLPAMHRRGEALTDQAKAHWPVCKPPDPLPLTLPGCRPPERKVYIENFSSHHLDFWRKVHPQHPTWPDLPPILGKILRFGKGHHRAPDMEKRAGGSVAPTTQPEIECLRANRLLRLDEQERKKQRTLASFFVANNSSGVAPSSTDVASSSTDVMASSS